MDDITKDLQDVPDDEVFVEIRDEEDNVFYFREERQMVIGKNTFAILVSLGDCECEDEICSCEEDEDIVIAKVEFDENSEPIYVDPTEEEFKAVKEAYTKEFLED